MTTTNLITTTSARKYKKKKYVRIQTLWLNSCDSCCMDCKKFDNCYRKCILHDTTCNQCTYRNFEPVEGRLI